MKRWYYTPAQVAPLLGWDAHYIRIMARRHPGKLPFPTVTHGSRTQIPKAPFGEWYTAMGGGAEELARLEPVAEGAS